ncbi:hypothetical protein Pedsa_0720 [Pseudopedobacter saltans DSM 12145]|uniref:Poly(Beta-D-mannuronate) lyase n=1 Tax=Pseudopedobacter saltans (strain ATCC 51119 / DSM 12145 / JCM 21818 / CCUG 39354 / LMG 10337 / NBRC 100064 / NCIMB 13643) TaxID=762903 RepID=F0S8L2_PSESL|nr:chondroitinase-B domain-containing protein [Pseudopedobacter saltans]ADY51296.1 hypothetical protein Pedsa_0720 [Pseudopedobacter saltans DSM 12145]
MKYKLLNSLIFILLSSIVKADIYYISSADDLNNLTWSSALKPGDKVIMRDGVWNSQDVWFTGEGTELNPITLVAEHAGSVIMSGNSKLVINGKWLVVDGLSFKNGYSLTHTITFSATSAHCRLTNTSIVNYNPPSKETDYKWVSIYGTYNRVDHCEFTGKDHQGTTLVVWLDEQPNYHRIDHNYFGPRPIFGANGAETIRVGTSDYAFNDSYTTIEENIFDRCDGEGELISIKSVNNIVRNNLFYECKGSLSLRSGNNTDVNGNYFIGNGKIGTGGIHIMGENQKVYNNYLYDITGTGIYAAISLRNAYVNPTLSEYYQVKNAQILGNTIVNCNMSIAIGTSTSDSDKSIIPPINSLISNNIIQTNNKPLITWVDATANHPGNVGFDNNLVFGMLKPDSYPSGIIVQDPLLEPNELNVYEPDAASPAKNSFLGNFPFYEADDIGAKPVGTLHKALLNGESIGPEWVTLPKFIIQRNIFDSEPGVWDNAGRAFTYDLGTGTGNEGKLFNTTGSANASTQSSRKFLPYIPTANGGGYAQVILPANGGGYFTLQDTDPEKATLKINASSNTSNPAKFSLYQIGNTTPVSSLFFNISFNDSTFTRAAWACAIGNYEAEVTNSIFRRAAGLTPNSNTSNPDVFGAFRWEISANNPEIINFQYRIRPNGSPEPNAIYKTINTNTFYRGGKFAIEVYANNDVIPQSYTRDGISYQLPSQTYHIWANGERMKDDTAYEFTVNQLTAGEKINSFMIQGTGSSSHLTAAVGDNAAAITIGNIKMDFASIVTLPVTLTSFNVKKQQANVLLNWTTDSEVNNADFEVLRSADGKEFNSIGNVKGAGNSNSVNSYSFTDRYPLEGVNFYKLRQVDYDGAGNYSEIRTVNIDFIASGNLKVFTTADINQVHFSYTSQNMSESVLQIIDVQGRKYTEQKIQLKKGENYFLIDSNLPSGGYIALLRSKDQVVVTKFIR